MRKVPPWLVPVVLGLILGSNYCPGQAPPRSPVTPASQPTKVTRVVDDDTVVLHLDGRSTTVRLIGVDTPETVDPRKPVERFGREASRFLKGLVEGKSIRVEYEPGASRLDRYGRTLAYLYLEPGGLFVNREIIARGFGHAYVKFPFKFTEDFLAAERSAREKQLGLWAPESGSKPTPATSSTVYVTRTGTKYHREGCRYLAKGAIAMSLDRAVGRYSPCSVCDPPTLAVDDVESASGTQRAKPRQ